MTQDNGFNRKIIKTILSAVVILTLTIVILNCTTQHAIATQEEKIFMVQDYGAVSSGETICTAAIQQAIDDCASNGGGIVQISGGTFLSGTIIMKSDVTLNITAGSTLLGSTNLEDYPVTVSEYRSYTENYTNKSLIYGENLSNIAITGKGTYDGQGAAFSGEYKDRPYGIRFISCTNVLVENITLKNSPMWMQHYLACDHLTIRDITVWNHSNKNNDMMDIDGCHDVLITGCVGDTDDDGITMKSTTDRACENITIENCTVSSHCNAIKVGTESSGGFRNIIVKNCSVKPSADVDIIYGRTDGLAGIALEIVDGGIMDNIVISDIQITGTTSPLFIRLGNRARKYKEDIPTPSIGTIDNVTISNITATDCSVMGCAIAGLPNHPIKNLTFKNIEMEFPGGGKGRDRERRFTEQETRYPECTMFAEKLPAYGFYFWHVDGITLENVNLTTLASDARDALVFEDSRNVVTDSN